MNTATILALSAPVVAILTLWINNIYQRWVARANAKKANAEAGKTSVEATVLTNKERRDQEEFKDKQIDRLQDMVEDLITKAELSEKEKINCVNELEDFKEKYKQCEKSSNEYRTELNFVKLELQAWKQKAEK